MRKLTFGALTVIALMIIWDQLGHYCRNGPMTVEVECAPKVAAQKPEPRCFALPLICRVCQL